MRDMVAEVRLALANPGMQPYFVVEDDRMAVRPISSMPGQKQFGVEVLNSQLDVQVGEGFAFILLARQNRKTLLIFQP